MYKNAIQDRLKPSKINYICKLVCQNGLREGLQ